MHRPDPREAEASRAEDLRDLEAPPSVEVSPAIPSAAVAAHAAPSSPDRTGGTDRAIWSLAWPVILSQILASTVSLVDIAMLGRLGKDAIAAVGFATQYLWLAQSILFAVGIACVALMSRAVGARQPERARFALAASLAVSIGFGALFSIAAVAAPGFLMSLIGAKPAIVEVGLRYFQLTLGASIALSVTIALESAFRAIKNTRTPMQIAAVVTAVKIAANYVLIFGAFGLPRLDLVGAGLATLIATFVGLALFAIAGRRQRGEIPIRASLRDLRAARPIYGEVIRISLPAIAERVVMNVAMMSYFRFVGVYGSEALAAYTIGIRLLSFSWIPGIGFSVAASTLVGQALGAYDPAAAAKAGWRCLRFALLTSLVLAVVFASLRNPLARAFTDDASVIAALGPFLLVLALTQPLLGLHFTLGGALRGAGDTLNPLIAATLGNWLFRVPLAWLVSGVLGLDVIWIWIVLVFDHLMRSIWLGIHFARGTWRQKLGVL